MTMLSELELACCAQEFEPIGHGASRIYAPSAYIRRKRTAVRIVAMCILMITWPLVAILSVLVRLTSRGPAFFRQVRVGRGGELFSMYKLRTMRADAEKESGPVWSQRNDPRVTWVGRWLRATHLDELPQLWNVVRGDMDLFGPRPERPEFTALLARHIPSYHDRLHILPGITGLAQINLPPDSDIDSVRQKLEWDLAYVERASLSMDLRLACCTLAYMFGMSRRDAARLTRIDCVDRLAPRDRLADSTLGDDILAHV